MKEEVRKVVEHPIPTPTPSPFTHFNKEEKKRIDMMVKSEISKVEREKYNHEMVIGINSKKPKLDDPNKQLERDTILQAHQRAVEIFEKDLEILESIQKQVQEEQE